MKMNKRAFIVLGAESSGTRLVTRLLMSAGCYGDDGHSQRLDVSIPDDESLLVWRRSVPHGRMIPDIRLMIYELEKHGYQVTAVVTTRDMFPMMHSQVKQGHVPNTTTARRNVQDAYRHIFSSLYGVDYVLVTLAGLYSNWRLPIILGQMLDLEIKHPEPIIDVDKKWLPEPDSVQS